jgi:hypothetical protein
MRISTLVLAIASLSVLAGCAGGKKELSAPYAPVISAEELAKDNAALDEETTLLDKLGLRFENRTLPNGRRVTTWSSQTSATASAGVQITALERFIEVAKKYVSKYTLYTYEGKVTSISAEQRETIEGKIQLAQKKIEQLGG